METTRSPAPAPEAAPETSAEKWHTLAAEGVLRLLETSAERGLTPEEASRRLAQVGPNELAEAPRPGLLQQLWEQFNNFIVLFLIAAAVVSALLGDTIEAGAIIAIVVLNAVLGVIQERRAEEALAALRKLAAPEAHIIRGGHRLTVPAREVVPGDVVLLEAGNYVPADLRLLETANLRVDEASLTGESVPVEKHAAATLPPEAPMGDQVNMAFMGTVVTYGRGRGVVVATGMQTQIGRIATMIQTYAEEPTPLQRRLDQLGRTLGWAALVVCGLVFGLGWLRGFDPLEMFIIAVSLAVAAVPEGLPAVVTITLALGMREMVRRNALVRRLASVETLGSTTVICSDKTGTLTQNRMTVTRIWVDGETFQVAPESEGGAPFRRDGRPVDLKAYPALTTALWVAVLNNDAVLEPLEGDGEGAYRVVGDPTEVALIEAAARAGARRQDLERAYPRIDEIPFDSARKRMTTVHKVLAPHPEDPSPFYDLSRREWEVAATKGAPEVLLDLCSHYQRMGDEPAPLTPEVRQRILEANAEMARQALRVLAVAYRVEPDVPDEATPETVERDLIFVGLIGMIDPPRPEVASAIEKARRAGIRTVMITGDYPETARAIAEQIGLLQPGHRVISGAEMEALDDEALRREVVKVDVFARVSPAHKVRIVEALKANNQVVAMTGDGVNDAPALKRADIGIAMGITGTDVAKETADMVLTDDNYVSIVAAVEQGRVIYANIRKFVFFLLSSNIAEIAIIFLAVLAGLPAPLTAIQLLWLNLVTDGAPALALGVEPGDPDIMEQPPRPPDEPIINRPMRIHTAVQTVAKTATTLAAFVIGLSLFPRLETAETMAFATLTFSELLRAFTTRSERYPLFKIGLFTNRYMLPAVLSSLVLLLVVIYVPFLQPIFDTTALGWREWQIVLPLLLVPAVAHEVTKVVMARQEA